MKANLLKLLNDFNYSGIDMYHSFVVTYLYLNKLA